jgi:hypothetical protein
LATFENDQKQLVHWFQKRKRDQQEILFCIMS